MDDALRKRLDAIIVLLVVVAVLLALTLISVGGGGLFVLALLLGFVAVTVTYSILAGDGEPIGPADEG
ncbi:hypothetical protein [Halorussus aquaticus]|uniref:Major facilitator superfamily (MFS) profile domain-containing protein n=1 Tax=Halorussus aquaticus TaxID=2953748 RepID=A0ABD5PX65_9EURY|nr:hypothetical protein [Halorussus aquaticus]